MDVAAETLRHCTTYLFDCDGVLWDSSHLLAGASDIITYLLETDRNVFLITNNSTKSVDQYAEKCRKLGLPVTAKNIVCSANVIADYLSSAGIRGPLYIVGEAGIGLELDKLGITHFGIGPDNAPDENITKDISLNENTTAVVVGFDIHFNYRKLLKATSYIAMGLPFFATNEDAQLPAEGMILPGTGSIVAAVKYASGKDPVVMGKPHPPMFDFLCRKHSINPSQTVMIGDRLDTDIMFGNRFGTHTACVLTGVTNSALLNKVQVSPTDELLRPNFTFESVQCILRLLQKADSR